MVILVTQTDFLGTPVKDRPENPKVRTPPQGAPHWGGTPPVVGVSARRWRGWDGTKVVTVPIL